MGAEFKVNDDVSAVFQLPVPRMLVDLFAISCLFPASVSVIANSAILAIKTNCIHKLSRKLTLLADTTRG